MEGDFTKPVTLGWWAIIPAGAGLIYYRLSQTFSPSFSRALLAWTLQLLHLRVSSGTCCIPRYNL
jgi:hypothetical protein